MFSTVSNVPPANACKTSSDLVIISRKLLTKPDNPVQSCLGNAVIDSRKTKGKAIADFRTGSTSWSEVVLSSAENSKAISRASSNVGGQSAALTATCSSDHLDTEQGKYDTGDKIYRQTWLSKSKKPKAINSIALPYEDQMCNTDSRVKGDLARHKKTHDIKRSFRCDLCDRELCSAGSLKRHARTHTGERPFQCDVCKSVFNRECSLRRHEKVHTGERPFECEMCGKSFAQRYNLVVHTDVHYKTPRYKCKVCGAQFYHSNLLGDHMHTHDRSRLLKCSTCGSEFKTRSSLCYHRQSHVNKCHYKCDKCTKTFRTSRALWEHKRIHVNECHYKCDKCIKTFKTSRSLWNHGRTHVNERHYKCDKCTKTFRTSRALWEHKRIHVNERHYKCDKCIKTFKTSNSLRNHRRTHVNERHYKCDKCIKTFKTSRALWEHKRIHVNERHYKCDKCIKAFKTSNSLWHHQQTHTDERPFECDRCGYGFKRKYSIERHYEKIHGKKYPGKSSKSFTNDRNSGRHSSQPESGHSNEEPFRGSHCDAGFTSTTISNQHIKPKNHTTYSETGVTNLNDVSTTSQLPFISNQPSTSSIHVNKSQNQEEYSGVEIVSFLNELADTYPVTTKPGSCEHDNNLSFDQKMPEETFPYRQIADAGCLINQLHPVVDWPSTSGIHVNKSQNQKEYSEYAETVALLNEFADTYPVTPESGSCERDNNLSFAQEMPEATFPYRQIADATCLINQLHPVVDWPSTSGIHVNKSQNQEEHEKTAKVLDYNHLQTIHSLKPSWKSGLSSWQLR